MKLRECLLTCSTLLALSGCGADAEVRGDWAVTISLRSDNLLEAYPGDVAMRQIFSDLQGSGEVTGAGGPTCVVEFTLEGRAFDEVTIPVELNFGTSDCSGSMLDVPAVINLNLNQEGDLLIGHTLYGTDQYGDPLRLYFSATPIRY